MELRIANGAFVHRIYDGTDVPELLAGFQYSSDAEGFAQSKVIEDATRDFGCSYAVTCAYSGRMRIFRQPAGESA